MLDICQEQERTNAGTENRWFHKLDIFRWCKEYGILFFYISYKTFVLKKIIKFLTFFDFIIKSTVKPFNFASILIL